MTSLSFDPDNTIAGGLFSMSPREAIALTVGLCDAAEQAVGADGCHGAIWPGNITAADGQVAIGPQRRVSIADMSPDALEFVAPEQFWGGTESPACDVYSIGLILYTALNGGAMPFFTADAAQSSEVRAAALRSRMKGKALPYPIHASRELGDVVCKALSFRGEDRYATPGRLKAALVALPEAAAIPAAAPVIPMSSEALKNAHSYKVDKDFEPAEPEKKKKSVKAKKPEGAVDENMDAAEFRKTPKKNRWMLPLILMVVVIVAVILLLHSCGKEEDTSFSIDPESAVETVNPIHSPIPTATVPPIEPVETESPEETAVPEETEDPEESEAKLPIYEIYLADVTWEQAKDLCDQKGGHLATVRNEEQRDEIIRLARENGASFVWLGAYRAENAQWYYVTGDTLDYADWDTGEPSAHDTDGTAEDYLLLWYRKSADVWGYNDMRNDPISVAAKTYSGKLAYVCEYDK